MIEQIRCTNCKSYKVKVTKKTDILTIATILLFSGIFFLLAGFSAQIPGSLFLVLGGVPLAIAGMIYMFKAVNLNHDVAECKNCGYRFDPDAENTDN